MLQPPFPRAMLLFAALLVLAFTLAACGGDDAEQTGPVAAPAPDDFPAADGKTLDELAAETTPTDEIVPSPAAQVFTPGPQRFPFGMFTVGGEQITDADVAIYAQGEDDKQAQGPFPARIESLETDPAFVAETTANDPESAQVAYVTEVQFEDKGEYRLLALVKEGSDLLATRLPSVVVGQYESVPEPGDKAPVVDTPTAAEVKGDLESIDTRVPPSTMHEDNLADVLGQKPVVLLFATPALCQSRVCGPVVDIAEQVKDAHGDDAAFIHMEIYENNRPPKLREQVEAYGLPTEPWAFVIDENGRVSSRLEGAFSVDELERAVDKVT